MTQLLLLHGFTGAPQSWEPVVRRLPSALEIFRPWILGHGPAFAQEQHGALPTFASEVARLAQWSFAQGFEAGVVAGYSLGGRLALGLCTRYPERFRAAVIVSAHPGLQTETERAQRRTDDRQWIALLEQPPFDRFLQRWEQRALFESQAALTPEAREEQSQIRRTHSGPSLALALAALGLGSMPDLRPGLAAYPHPLALLAGGLDSKFQTLAAEMARVLPSAELHTAPGVGHNLLLECPSLVATILTRHADALARSRSA